MVMFNTLEERVGEVIMSPENETKNMIQNIEHSQDCINPEIKIEYVTINSRNDTYGTKKKIIAGCACGSKISIDTADTSSNISYSSSSEDKEALSYY